MAKSILGRVSDAMGADGTARRSLIRGGVGSMALKLSSTILGLAVTAILTRSMGAHNYGIYAYVLALVSLMSIPAEFGLPNLIVRETAKAQVRKEWAVMKGLWRWASVTCCGLSAALALIGVMAVHVFSEGFSAQHRIAFYFGVVLMPFLALGNLRGSALRGLGRSVLGQLPESIIRPSVYILLIAGLILVTNGSITAPTAMATYAAAAGVSFVIGALILWRLRPRQIMVERQVVYRSKEWIAAVLPMAAMFGINLVNQNAGLLVLGWFRSPSEVGVYRVAISVAAFSAFTLQAITLVLAPHFAQLHARGELDALQRLVISSSRAIFLLSVPLVLMFVAFGGPILAVVFGQGFGSGHLPLALLSIGQLVSASMGSVAYLLNMTGHERATARGIFMAAVINILLNFALVPHFGMAGAAVAGLVSIISWNVLLGRDVAKRLGIKAGVLASFKHDV